MCGVCVGVVVEEICVNAKKLRIGVSTTSEILKAAA